MDYFSKYGASVLAQRVKEYWLRREIRVNTWIEEVGVCDADGPLYQVRSDLVGRMHVPIDRNAMLRRHGN